MFRSRTASLPLRLLVVLAALLCTVAGCGNRSNENDDDEATPASGKDHTPGVLRYALTAEPTTLDPALVSDGPTIDVLMQIYEGLVGWNENNEVTPLAAAALPKISPDGRTYTFKLRPGLKFTDGRDVVAEDVKYSLTRALDPKLASPVATTYLNDIEGWKEVADGKTRDLRGVRVLDSRTVEITLVGPRAYFLGKLTYPTGYILDRETVERGEKTEGGAYTVGKNNTVGTGPFKLHSYQPQSKVVLSANEGYWNGKPKLTRIERPIVLSGLTRRNLYETGKLDMVDISKADYEQDRDSVDRNGELHHFDRAAVYYLGMNQTHYAPFRDKRVRQAFAYAIDKDAIIKDVLLGINPRAEGVVPIGVPGYDPEFKGIPFDPNKARELLAAAGYPDGQGLPPITLSFREQQPDLTKTAEVVQQQLSDIGVEVRLNEMEWATFLKETDAKRLDFIHLRWSADYLDPQNFLSVLLKSDSPENRVAYKNAAYDALLTTADASTDWDKRRKLYRQAERLVVDDAPWVPLYFQRDIELIKPHVTDLRDSLMGHLPHTTTRVE